jgi:hypothetical protein
MLPDGVLSSIPQPAPIIGAKAKAGTNKLDFEDGPIALNDPSQGLMIQEWTGVSTDTGVFLFTATLPPEYVLIANAIQEISFTFDQNGRPVVGYLQYGLMKLQWFDASAGMQVITTFTSGNISPKVFLDDKRTTQSGNSDILLGYIRNENLYYRQQRDRFLIEYLLATQVRGRLERLGMGRNLRVQFVCGHY